MQPRQKFTIGAIPTLLLLMAMILSACGGGSASSTPSNSGQKAAANQQVFNFPEASISDIKTFDPALVTTETSLDAIYMVFTGLVGLNDKLDVVPQMAQSWKQGSDGVTWTFTLKQGLKFSDGTPITSKDVAYSIDRALQPSLNSPASPSYLNLIKDSDKLLAGKIKTIIGDSIKTPDDNSVIITANKPASYFLATLTYPTAYVVEKSLIDKYGTKWTDHLTEGGGDGPFKVQEYTHGQRIVFVPNANYYGAKPQLQKVNFLFIKDTETAYKDYQVGTLDQAAVPTAHLAEAQKLTSEYHKIPVLSIFYYGMNFLAKPFDNINIRKAFALALNKDAIVKAVYKNVDTPTNHIVPQGMPGYNADLKGPDGTTSTSGNPTMAKQLLQQGMQEAGYSSVAQLPAIKFSYPSGIPDVENEVAVAVQQWQSVLGISVKPAAVDFETLSASLPQTVGNANVQFFYTGWGDDYPDPQDFLTLQFAPNSPNNQTNYGQNHSANAAAQQQVQQALIKADTTADQAARMKAYNDAEQQLVNDVTWLPMFQLARSRVLKSYMHGIVYNAQDFFPPEMWGNVYVTAH
jgi:oligopeptide transport system substrate-binding protein